MKTALITAVGTATAAATIGLAAPAHAGPDYSFQSPSGNIACLVFAGDNGAGSAMCEIGNHTYMKPPPAGCPYPGWGDRVEMDQGSAPGWVCHGDTMIGTALATLPYGQTRAAGPISCDSETSGVTCTDSSTGHFFRLSSESYQLG